MAKRYHKFWITDEKESRRRLFHFRKRLMRVWVNLDELKEYVKTFPRGHMVFVQEFEEECEQGHTYRQILGLEGLDCDCCND